MTEHTEQKRSGTLRIGSDAYKDKLNLKFGDVLMITVLEKDK